MYPLWVQISEKFHSEDVFNMLALQWDKDSAIKASFDDGVETGENRFAKLIDTLIKNGKSKNIQIALNDKYKRNSLYKEYGII